MGPTPLAQAFSPLSFEPMFKKKKKKKLHQGGLIFPPWLNLPRSLTGGGEDTCSGGCSVSDSTHLSA